MFNLSITFLKTETWVWSMMWRFWYRLWRRVYHSSIYGLSGAVILGRAQEKSGINRFALLDCFFQPWHKGNDHKPWRMFLCRIYFIGLPFSVLLLCAIQLSIACKLKSRLAILRKHMLMKRAILLTLSRNGNSQEIWSFQDNWNWQQLSRGSFSFSLSTQRLCCNESVTTTSSSWQLTCRKSLADGFLAQGKFGKWKTLWIQQHVILILKTENAHLAINGSEVNGCTITWGSEITVHVLFCKVANQYC